MHKYLRAWALLLATIDAAASVWAQGWEGAPGFESANPHVRQKPVRRDAPKQKPPAPRREQASEAPAVPPSRPAPAGNRISFVWANSDTLEKIAAACQTTPADILRENDLRRAELREGQVLSIPAPAEGEQLAAFSKERQLAREVWRGIRGSRRVALTFDAGGEPDGAKELLGALREAGVTASFFVTGQFTAKHKELVKQMAADGHPVYNHSWSHPEFTSIPDDKMVEELERTDWAVRDITGTETKPFWRPPFGDRDNRVLRVTGAAGYQSIYWTLDSLDSVGEKKSPAFIVNRILNPPKSGGDPDRYLDGAILLMHVGETGTARAVPEVIRQLKQRGFRFATVAEILRPVTSQE